ncbi:adenylosuccinate lyase [Ketogulonicigenium robustum]|uniref:Adenylosuccinate lyase n=1 Tax=Ketogulonicigenium robustum TaxID=92947 RepID=A0A1W6P1G9_9RHOB|nr:lyase family protein [Ketogulonicigenium robustum]ARO15284.1 adenylosuccinate lyase [Ketogulonicigenium robustum]
MPASIADSAMFRGLFGDDQLAALFTDSAEVRAMLLVEGELAAAQGALGIIPPEAAEFIARSAREVQIDPAGLAAETAVNGVPVPALINAFRKAMQAPEYAQYLHWGTTSQDIVDTALALRLRRVLGVLDTRLGALVESLGAMAGAHADLPLAARTYGQFATPTSFGAVVAQWGRPLQRHRARVQQAGGDVACVSLGGAAGTLSALEGQGPAVRATLAERLRLRDPGHSWHPERDSLAALMAAMAALTASLGKMAEDVMLMVQSGIGEVRLAGAGGSSTMPQKQNPVGPSVIVALSHQVTALNAAFQGAAVHRQQRDGAAWFTEWLTLPQIVLCTGRALTLARDVVAGLTPDQAAMARNMDAGGGLIHAEAYSFALARHMPRPAAQARVKDLCAEAMARGQSLGALVAAAFPELALGDVEHAGLGEAPAEARAFAAAVAAGA